MAMPMPTNIPINFVESSEAFFSVTMLLDRMVKPSGPSLMASRSDYEMAVASSFVLTIRRKVVLMEPHNKVFGIRTPLSFAGTLNRALMFPYICGQFLIVLLS